MKLKFDLEEEVIIKENGAVGWVIDRQLVDEWLYVVTYIASGVSFCEEFYENELEKYELVYGRRT